MKLVVRLLTILSLLAGSIVLLRLSLGNRELKAQIDRLEAELGRMPIDNPDRVHLVEIETPAVPPEVAAHVERVWQFRCYLPPGYALNRFNGEGRVAEDGVYLAGGSVSGRGTPQADAVHELLTVSFRKVGDRWEVFNAFGGSARTSLWRHFAPGRFDDAIVEKIVSRDQGPRSFDPDTILPLLRIYDPRSAEEVKVAGETTTTYAGGFFVLYPLARESEFYQLTRGETPADFDPSWIAAEASDE